MADEKATIDIMKDGPFIVNNLPVLENSKGDILEINNKAALCRCGASANKPFCDGTHSKIGFNGNRVSKLKLDKEIEYKGKNISIYYNPSLCYHAAECVGNMPQVFNSNAKPWINPDNSDNDSIINTINKCPSGALSYKVGEVHERSTGADRKIIIEKTDHTAYQAILNCIRKKIRGLLQMIIMHYTDAGLLKTSRIAMAAMLNLDLRTMIINFTEYRLNRI